MLRLARPEITPPGGFRYHDPDLNRDFTAPVMSSLVLAVNRVRSANGLVPVDTTVVEDWLCQQLPRQFSRLLSSPAGRRTKAAALPPVPIPSTQAARVLPGEAMAATMKFLRRGTGIVDWDRAAPRASICRTCQFNAQEPVCFSCKLSSVFAPIVGTIRYKTGSPINFAGVCACDGTYLKATLGVPAKLFTGAYPDHCWKRQVEPIQEPT